MLTGACAAAVPRVGAWDSGAAAFAVTRCDAAPRPLDCCKYETAFLLCTCFFSPPLTEEGGTVRSGEARVWLVTRVSLGLLAAFLLRLSSNRCFAVVVCVCKTRRRRGPEGEKIWMFSTTFWFQDHKSVFSSTSLLKIGFLSLLTFMAGDQHNTQAHTRPSFPVCFASVSSYWATL